MLAALIVVPLLFRLFTHFVQGFAWRLACKRGHLFRLLSKVTSF